MLILYIWVLGKYRWHEVACVFHIAGRYRLLLRREQVNEVACVFHIAGRYRLLLRREQVHKVACNHLLTTDMHLQPLQTSETAWCWFAYDYSDEEPRMDKFAVRFKASTLIFFLCCLSTT